MAMLKVIQKQSTLHTLQVVHFLKYILRIKHGGFLNETSILYLAKLATFHFIFYLFYLSFNLLFFHLVSFNFLSNNELMKNC